MEKKASDTGDDLRNLAVNHMVRVSDEFADAQSEFGVTSMNQHKITITTISGTQVGYMDFIDVENVPYEILMEREPGPDDYNIVDRALYVNNVEVNEEYRQAGIGYKIYEEFGKIYNEQFNGWPVARYFVNPVAEYSFRKAVANGLISENALTEQYINRGYNKPLDENDNRTQLWQDLRQKLPEQYRGPEIQSRLKKIKLLKTAEEEKVDLRNIQFEFSNWNYHNYITAKLNGQKVGEMDFKIVGSDNHIEIDSVDVDDKYRNLGIGQLLYKEFGNIYSQKYMGTKVKRFFINPIAEYSFRKAVGLGWVPQEALQEDDIARVYTDTERNLAKDLRNKLPEHVQGPETWSKIKRLRMIRKSEEQNIETTYFFEDWGTSSTNDITLLVNGDHAGFLAFTADTNGKYIEIIQLEVDPKYQNQGLAYEIYKKFGEIYSEKFNGWPVERHFMNPVAEYAFRNSVSKGFVPESALTEPMITRDYKNYDSQTITDLRNKLPDNLKGPETWAKLTKRLLKKENAVNYVSDSYDGEEKKDDKPDIEWNHIEIDVQNIPREENKNGADHVVDHEIYCDYYGSQIGYMHFSEFHNVTAKDVHTSLENKHYDEMLYVNNVLVNSEYRGYGIGKKLYEKFGEIYKQDFMDWPVAQVFANPIAEYVFKEEVDKGNIPETAYNDDLIARQYDEHEKQIAKDLFDWLPAKEKKKFKKSIERKDYRDKGDKNE
jgi:GNAT superfamily N-acetyltransferase